MTKENIGTFVLPSFFGCVRFTHFDFKLADLHRTLQKFYLLIKLSAS